METRIQKWGNSLGVRLPKKMAENKSLRAGSRVVVRETNDGLVIVIAKKGRLTLDELLENFDPKTQHDLVDWGEDVGREII